MAVPWRERPRDLAGSAITPAATEEVAHATLSLSQPESAISSMRPAQSAKARAICTVSSSAVALDCAVRGRALKALRVASPALRAAGGLDRAIREPLDAQLSTASREPLDDARRRRYCRILFDGCGPQPPSHRPMWSTSNRRPQATIRFSLDSLPGRRFARRHVREANDRNGLRFGLRPGARSVQTSDRHRHAATAVRLSVVDASEPHSVLPIHSRTSTRNRHRRSTWAGVSWPNDDGTARAAATTSAARSHEREQPDRRAV